MKRKIAESINLRINIGNYQHIELVKYAEEEIEYANDKERVDAEKSLTNDLVDSLNNSIEIITEKTGRGRKEVIEVEQSLLKAVPEWLNDKNVPNIAKGSNPAKSMKEKVSLIQKDEEESLEELDAELAEFEEKVEKKEKLDTIEAGEDEDDVDDFFDDDGIFD